MPGRPSDGAGASGKGAPPADVARLATEHGLGAYQRTKVDRVWSAGQKFGLVLFPVAVIASPTAVIPLVDGNPADLEFGLIWAPFIGCLIALGALLVWARPPVRVARNYWYADGLVQRIAGEPEPRVIRWDNLASVTIVVWWSDDDPTYILTSTVCDHAGTCLTANGSRLAVQAAEILTTAVVPGFIRAFDGGEPVSFDTLRIDRSGITDGGGTSATAPVSIAWADMRSITVRGRVRFEVQTGAKGRPVIFDLQVVPNGMLAHYVIEHAAAQANVPVTYLEDDRFPPRRRVADLVAE